MESVSLGIVDRLGLLIPLIGALIVLMCITITLHTMLKKYKRLEELIISILKRNKYIEEGDINDSNT